MKAKALGRILCLAAILLAAGGAMADVFNMGSGLTSLDMVPVGNAGNAADTATHSGNSAGQGEVGYEYNIGKYEVTAGQYTEFLNAVAGADSYALYNSDMWSSSYGCKIERHTGTGTQADPYQYRVAANYANRPVNFVSWGDATRFANWLTNGRGNGDTESGAYALNGAMTDTQLMAVAVPSAAQRATWSTGETPYFLLTSEDEWYKAAYHDENAGLSAGYFDYPTSNNMVPSNDLVAPDPGNNATFYDSGYTIEGPYRTEVGSHENSDTPYGTFDQGGNVWEWNEAKVLGAYRGLRGGSFRDIGGDRLHASFRNYNDPTVEYFYIGFRVSEVPEPGTMAILALGVVGMLRRRLR